MSEGVKSIRADLFGEDKTRCHYEERGAVALLTIEDDGLNGYSYKMFRDIDDAILKARFNPSIEAIVITGAGGNFGRAGAEFFASEGCNIVAVDAAVEVCAIVCAGVATVGSSCGCLGDFSSEGGGGDIGSRSG